MNESDSDKQPKQMDLGLPAFQCCILCVYFANCSAWVSEMMAVITALEYPRDLQGAEASMTRWKEHRAEVDSRKEAVNNFLKSGQSMIGNKHFLSDQVRGITIIERVVFETKYPS